MLHLQQWCHQLQYLPSNWSQLFLQKPPVKFAIFALLNAFNVSKLKIKFKPFLHYNHAECSDITSKYWSKNEKNRRAFGYLNFFLAYMGYILWAKDIRLPDQIFLNSVMMARVAEDKNTPGNTSAHTYYLYGSKHVLHSCKYFVFLPLFSCPKYMHISS